MCVCVWCLLPAQVEMMRGVFEKLVEVSQDEEIPEGLAETAEDLVSADVMNHPVRQTNPLPSTNQSIKNPGAVLGRNVLIIWKRDITSGVSYIW